MNCTGTSPMSGSGMPLHADRHRIEKAKEQAGEHCLNRAPLGEDQCRKRYVTLARSHVLDEAGALGRRQIGASNAAQHAATDDRAIAQPWHGDAGRIHRRRVFANGAQAQAKTRAVEHPPSERHHGKGEIDEIEWPEINSK